MRKARIAIIGTGNIGSDLLAKIQRSPYLECTKFIGRNLNSKGILFAIRNADFILAIGFRLATAAVGHDARNFGKFDKMPNGTLVMHKYEDMFPFFPADEFKDSMIAEK